MIFCVSFQELMKPRFDWLIDWLIDWLLVDWLDRVLRRIGNISQVTAAAETQEMRNINKCIIISQCVEKDTILPNSGIE